VVTAGNPGYQRQKSPESSTRAPAGRRKPIGERHSESRVRENRMKFDEGLGQAVIGLWPFHPSAPAYSTRPRESAFAISNDNKPRKQNIMKAIIRKYSGKGAKELFDALEKQAAEIQPIMRSVKGFVSYTLARSDDGGFTVTVCQDQAGIDESTQKAKDWIAKNASNTGAAAPEASVGNVLMHL
jgi:hypothetical protein